MTLKTTSISGALKDYLDVAKQSQLLLAPLSKHLLTTYEPSDRSTDRLHPSEVSGHRWCPRHAQQVLEGQVVVEQTAPRLQLSSIFANGHAIHHKWQNWLASMGALFGDWTCTECGTRYAHTTGSQCCDAVMQYHEVSLQHGIWDGHADGIVVLQTLEEPVLLEVKSIGPGTIRTYAPSLLKDADGVSERAFQSITVPFRAHQKQVQLYLELIDRMYRDGTFPFPVEQAVVLYENKADSATKEFLLKRDLGLVRDLLDEADRIEQLLGTGELVECPFEPGKCGYHGGAA